MDLDYKFPICNILSTSPKISINTAIAINIKNNINYFASNTDNSNKIIKIVEIPNDIKNHNYKGTYNYNNIPAINFKFSTSGKYKYSFYLKDEKYKTFSNICSGTINVFSCYESCFSCLESSNKTQHKCIKCSTDNGYFRLEKNTIKPFNCYNSKTIKELSDGYYLYISSSEKYWKNCFSKCKECEELGNEIDNKCTLCKDGLIWDSYNLNNCVTKCDKYWRRDDNKIDHICLDKCNNDYPYEVEDTYECVNSCMSANNNGKIYYYYNGKCILKCPDNTLSDRFTSTCHLISNFDDFYNGITNYIISINPPSNIYIYNDTINFILFNSTDESIEDYKSYCEKYNMAILNLNECFEELRKEYQIAEYLYFYVALFNFKRSDTNTPQFDFIIYNQYGVKYRNEICNEIKISKSFKNNIVSSDLINKYTNSNIDTIYYSKSNKFYNDICFTCSNDSYDILLEDRYEIFHNNTNYYFCEDNCNITDINFSNFRVDCVCSNISSFNEYNKKEYGIYKEEKIIYDKNFQFMKCSNL